MLACMQPLFPISYVHCKWLQGICREIAVFLALQQNPAESKPAGVNYCMPAPAARAEKYPPALVE